MHSFPYDIFTISFTSINKIFGFLVKFQNSKQVSKIYDFIYYYYFFFSFQILAWFKKNIYSEKIFISILLKNKNKISNGLYFCFKDLYKHLIVFLWKVKILPKMGRKQTLISNRQKKKKKMVITYHIELNFHITYLDS